ncbi:MAG: adenylate/guanylate cyclase domain-containing protein [Treponema sp.]|jgi:adenylate cyclase|nr:adenylate/guanylate cyclase domain-containing protein [Treponema sp.]
MSRTKRNKPSIWVSLAAVALSSLLFFTSLDNKLFDMFLRVLPSLTENEKVFVLTLDDDSINYAGGFPFRREVMADVVILLKELGAQAIAFDLSYLDESPYRLDPAYAAEVFGRYLDSGFSWLDEAAVAIIDGIDPATGQEERELYKQDIRYIQDTVRGELEASLSFLARDVDEYFAQALAFTGCSWLTLTMLRPEDFLDAGSSNDQSSSLGINEIDSYLAEYIALKNVSVASAGDTRTPVMAGVMPAISKLMSRAAGAGFVNANPDTDGIRRRINLLVKYNGAYYGHLSLVALWERMGYSTVEVSDRAITLKKSDGGDLRIPRAQDGTLLLKWPKKLFSDYKVMSLVGLIQHTIIEPVFAQNMALMHDAGIFTYWDDSADPWEWYVESEIIKNEAFADIREATGEWLLARQAFFESCQAFLYGGYEESILADLGDDWETVDFVQILFSACRAQFDRMAEIRRGASALQGSFCVIGADATSMTDNGLITFQEHYPNVGTYAVAANMMLAREFLSDAPWYVSAIIALLSSLIIGFLISCFETYSSIITGISGLLILGGIFIAIFALFKTYLGFAMPLAATALTYVSLMVIKFLTASHEKAFLHNAFSRYLAPEVITDIINNPDKLNLGGEKREMTAMFTDIQGFSTISEKLDAPQLVKLLNRYLTAMSNIIMENLGTIDKYEGDAIIAFFGAPVFRADHPDLTCRSALAMKAAERELNKVVVDEGLSPVPLFTRIGINTGEMVVGNMGAENKMDYTIMGNAVNLAARLEGVNKQYHTGGILISEYTKEKIGDEFLLRRLDRVRVVGINTPLRLYELLGLMHTATDDEKDTVIQWEQALNLYELRQFKAAAKQFHSLMERDAKDKVAELYAGRCMKYETNPPPEVWDAVNNLTEK